MKQYMDSQQPQVAIGGHRLSQDVIGRRSFRASQLLNMFFSKYFRRSLRRLESSHLEGTLNNDCFGFRKPVCWSLESQRTCNMQQVYHLECTSNEMKTARQKHELTRCSGSPSCPSHTKAATSSPLSGCWPSLVIQLNPRRSHTHLRRGLRAHGTHVGIPRIPRSPAMPRSARGIGARSNS